MDITESQLNSVTVLTLSGRLDGLTSSSLERKVDALLAAGTRKLVFDCGRLLSASSAGLRVFLSSVKKLKSAGGINRCGVGRFLRCCGSLKPLKQAGHFANYSGRDRLDFAVKSAEEEDAFLKPFLQRCGDRRAE